MSARRGWAGALLMALVVPGLLAAGAAFLQAGPVATLRAAEARGAEEAVAAAVQAFGAGLAGAEGLELRLGPEGRPEGPFLPAQSEPPLQAAGAAEEIGLALETRGRTEEALAFLERAREQELLGPEGRRALARLLAGQGRGLEARALLARDPEPAGPVERLFALLLDARIAAGLGQPEVAWRLKDSLLLGAPPIPAAAAGPCSGIWSGSRPESCLGRTPSWRAQSSSGSWKRGA